MRVLLVSSRYVMALDIGHVKGEGQTYCAMQHTLAVEYLILIVLERFQDQMTRRAIG